MMRVLKTAIVERIPYMEMSSDYANLRLLKEITVMLTEMIPKV